MPPSPFCRPPPPPPFCHVSKLTVCSAERQDFQGQTDSACSQSCRQIYILSSLTRSKLWGLQADPRLTVGAIQARFRHVVRYVFERGVVPARTRGPWIPTWAQANAAVQGLRVRLRWWLRSLYLWYVHKPEDSWKEFTPIANSKTLNDKSTFIIFFHKLKARQISTSSSSQDTSNENSVSIVFQRSRIINKSCGPADYHIWTAATLVQSSTMNIYNYALRSFVVKIKVIHYKALSSIGELRPLHRPLGQGRHSIRADVRPPPVKFAITRGSSPPPVKFAINSWRRNRYVDSSRPLQNSRPYQSYQQPYQ